MAMASRIARVSAGMILSGPWIGLCAVRMTVMTTTVMVMAAMMLAGRMGVSRRGREGRVDVAAWSVGPSQPNSVFNV